MAGAAAVAIAFIFAFSAFGEDTKTIRIATPSWDGQTNKDGTGILFEIVKTVYEPEEIKMEYQIVPWERAEKMIAEEKADAMVSARKKEGRITPKYPMWVEHKMAVFKKDKIRWEGIRSFNDRTAVWLRGYDEHLNEHLKDVKFKKWYEVDHYDQLWGMLEKERADFYIDILVDIDNYIKKAKIDMTPYQLEMMWYDNSYMSFSKSDKSKKLVEIYDRRIMELFKSGELEKLFKKWNVRFEPDAWKE